MTPSLKRASSNLNDSIRKKIAATASYDDRPQSVLEQSNEHQLRVVTGSVEHILHWRRVFPQLIALWEVYGTKDII